ncbi:MAG: uncharacterized protein JWP97_6027 [Labilithrix sp.]|nr:uncharacterized protein [Labilithrix sp.]
MRFPFPNLLALLVIGATSTALAGCTAEADDEVFDESAAELSALRDGVNSSGCRRSAYNCALNPGSGQRVLRADGKEDWAVDPAWLTKEGFVDPATKEPRVPVLDGNGDLMGLSKKMELTLNHGQTRRLKNRTWVMALSAGVGSAGWVPIDAFVHAESLRARVGEVNAHGAGLKDMACYEVRSTYDEDLDGYKVVKGAKVTESMEPNDYLPMKRSNGKVYANLAFSVPGDALGAPAVDIFPAGTRFQRLDVPTWESDGAPSLDVKLYSRTKGSDAFSDLAKRRMKFLYGYVKSADGTVRYGWMPQDGLTPSSGCPNR